VPPREWRVRVNDIIDAAERAVRYTDGLTFDEFRADARTVDAVSFTIVTVGEAANAVPESVTRTAPEIPWTDIRGMRNKIAHEYFGIDAKLLWQTVREDLPPLIATLRALASRSDPD
jgi:uncharacterized protein with HEPN domain